MSSLHATAWPDAIEVARGDAGLISVAISNTSDVIDAYEVQVFGLDPEWLEITPKRLSLFPGVTENVDIRVRLPDDYPSSDRLLAVNVVSEDDPTSFTLSEVALSIKPLAETSIELDPTMITGGGKATFGIVIANSGNAAIRAVGFAIDPEDLAEFTFEPPDVLVSPGREQVIEVTATGGRAWFGQARARSFTVGVDAEKRVEALATFIQRPRISRWLVSLLGLLTAAAIFALVLSRSFNSVVDDVTTDQALIEAALADAEGNGAVVPTDPSTVTGVIISVTTGTGIPGVQTELFAENDPANAVATASTGADGTFSFPKLSDGEYLLRFSGVGIEPVWYDAASDVTDATTISVAPDSDVPLDPIIVGGIPVDVTGKIDVTEGTDVADVKITLLAPGLSATGSGQDGSDQDGSDGGPVIVEADVAADGSFVLPDVPSPGTYQLVVEQPGAGPTTRDVVLAPGEEVDDIEVEVAAGSGVITGEVRDSNGPLEGATITATDGAVEIQTVSLTEGDERGTFTLRNLPTPAQYTVTIEREGYTPETQTAAFDTERSTFRLSAVLVPSTGTVSGRATVDGNVERGLEVTVSGGDVNETKPVVSQGSGAGTYQFADLPVPATYTLTFTGPDVIPQVRVVDLDPTTGSGAVSGIDVSMSKETTVVGGVVSGPDGQPVAGAQVTLGDGSTEFTFPTADEPAGQFEFAAVPPGSYTLTASRSGTEPAVILVTVAASEPPSFFDISLGRQAALTGRVIDPSTGSGVPGRIVRIFTPAQFPNPPAVAETTTDAQGGYRFDNLGAPEPFLVAVYLSLTTADPIDSVLARTIPSQDTAVADLQGVVAPP